MPASKDKDKAKKRQADRSKLPQKERFIQAARDAGVDETGETFERAINAIIPLKKS